MRTLYFYFQLEDIYEDQINEWHDIVSICGHEYDPGRALRLIDEIAFREGVLEMMDAEFNEICIRDMTEEEIDHYQINGSQVMYCRHEEIEE